MVPCCRMPRSIMVIELHYKCRAHLYFLLSSLLPSLSTSELLSSLVLVGELILLLI